jgi:hypothetical protein
MVFGILKGKQVPEHSLEGVVEGGLLVKPGPLSEDSDEGIPIVDRGLIWRYSHQRSSTASARRRYAQGFLHTVFLVQCGQDIGTIPTKLCAEQPDLGKFG